MWVRMSDVGNMRYLRCGMFEMWVVWGVECLGYAMLRMLVVPGDMRCFGMWMSWDVKCLYYGITRMSDDRNVTVWKASIYGFFSVPNTGEYGPGKLCIWTLFLHCVVVGCLGCGMFAMWYVWNARCLGCRMLLMWNVRNVGWSRCETIRMWDVGYGMFARI